MQKAHVWKLRLQAAGFPAASANHNVTINIPREKPEEWPLCLPLKLKHNDRAQDSLIPNKTF